MPAPDQTVAETRQKKLEKAREYKRIHRAEILAWQRKYNAARSADPERRAKKLAADRASRKRHAAKRWEYDKARDKVKVRARLRVRNLIYEGRLKRLPCEICGDPKSHAHHHDYSKPLDIKWLCPFHHKAEHQYVG